MSNALDIFLMQILRPFSKGKLSAAIFDENVTLAFIIYIYSTNTCATGEKNNNRTQFVFRS